MEQVIITLILALTALLLGSATAAAARQHTTLYVFGNSLSDNGNYYEVLPTEMPDPPSNGDRWSNGPVWCELLADSLSLGPLLPSRRGGNNHAWGNAKYVVVSRLGASSLVGQVGVYRDRLGDRLADTDALYAIEETATTPSRQALRGSGVRPQGPSSGHGTCLDEA